VSILERIRGREDLLQLSEKEELLLCEEIRAFLLARVSDAGGHLASNLGIVEATLALHKVYDTAVDRLVFDVGHQSYVHKILTGRAEEFSTLRKFDGMSGFPKPEESPHDAFVAGHASNSVSVALGFARARTRLEQKHHVAALIGDGALTGGLAFEGLNDAGESGEPMVVILNDNEMSISRNVGGISRHLSLLRLKPGYFGLKKAYRKFALAVPGGKWLYKATHRLKKFLKRSLIGTTVFEEMGLMYLGPVDGHDIGKMTYLLSVAKEMACPVLLHIITQKGRGYEPAEIAPQDYHGVGQFDPEVGISSDKKCETYSQVFGDELTRLAGHDSRICAITAAMPQGTGLSSFAREYPDRFFDVGIAEGHAVTTAAGMAAGGLIPVFAVYSTFLQRGYDMLLHDVALMGNHVVFAVDRAGLVGEDGPTHHGVFDVGYLSQIPGMTIFAPATAQELRQMLSQAIYVCNGPAAIRYSRGYCCAEDALRFETTGVPSAALVTYGLISANVYAAAKMLAEQGISVSVIRLKTLRPLDFDHLLDELGSLKHLFVIEDVVDQGSVGQQIAATVSDRGQPFFLERLNLGSEFTQHGNTELLWKHAGLDASGICRRVREALRYEE